jgi:hypothetical protein
MDENMRAPSAETLHEYARHVRPQYARTPKTGELREQYENNSG